MNFIIRFFRWLFGLNEPPPPIAEKVHNIYFAEGDTLLKFPIWDAASLNEMPVFEPRPYRYHGKRHRPVLHFERNRKAKIKGRLEARKQ